MDKTHSYLQLVVPKELQDTILPATHDAVTSAHLGVKKNCSQDKAQILLVPELDKKMCKVWCPEVAPQNTTIPLQDYRVGAPMDRLVANIPCHPRYHETLPLPQGEANVPRVHTSEPLHSCCLHIDLLGSRN